MNSETLVPFGWTRALAHTFEQHQRPGCEPGRILETHREHAHIQLASGPVRAFIRGNLLGGPESPIAGDWVQVRVSHQEGVPSLVESVLPRSTVLSRRAAGQTGETQLIAVNIDTVFIVVAVDRDFSARRVERYLAAVHAGGATPVVVLSKTDTLETASEVEALSAQLREVEVVPICALQGVGLDRLERWCQPGRTLALVGSSGVGKSTLANALIGEERQQTQQVREDDKRGRHTTTTRTLIPLSSGAMLLDTPGMRSLGLSGDGADIDATFTDVTAIAERCAWRDCTHDHPTGCAVLAAVDRGELDPERFRAYLKLQREADYERRRTDVRAAREAARSHQKVVRAHQRMQRYRKR